MFLTISILKLAVPLPKYFTLSWWVREQERGRAEAVMMVEIVPGARPQNNATRRSGFVARPGHTVSRTAARTYQILQERHSRRGPGHCNADRRRCRRWESSTWKSPPP